ncbi:DUF5367 domain-containing protein [Aureibacter tunicatorum]|uniref:Uncharacterized protein n=1 Tax=Aureibacter tunicatorum TaxID=866807 RepID=A0AAE3XR09_9BACT|nr:DUF5367 domain-containing protein [Aureibacter tunicatorum]MDR6241173.1 hypothetical protein [Aureibacter tunicatorum]BDD03948.1 hypothetical protein AUTU_14310 [Aureibacter tunicatorum]
MNYKKFSLTFGFLVWLFSSLPFRYWGNSFFIIKNPFILILLFLGVIPVLYLLTTWVFHRFKLTGLKKLESSAFMAIPGMICDVACLKFHDIVFPKLTIEEAIVLGSWVLWAYSIVLLIGILEIKKVESANANCDKHYST